MLTTPAEAPHLFRVTAPPLCWAGVAGGWCSVELVSVLLVDIRSPPDPRGPVAHRPACSVVAVLLGPSLQQDPSAGVQVGRGGAVLRHTHMVINKSLLTSGKHNA